MFSSDSKRNSSQLTEKTLANTSPCKMTRLRTKLNSAGILKTGTNLYCNFDSLNLFDLFNGLLGIEK